MIMSPHRRVRRTQSPRMIEILRPDELKIPFIVRHVETLLKEITEWEDYDDEEPSKTAIGFQPITIPIPMKNNITSQNLIFSRPFWTDLRRVMLLIPFWLAGHFAVEEPSHMIKWAGIQDCAIGGMFHHLPGF